MKIIDLRSNEQAGIKYMELGIGQSSRSLRRHFMPTCTCTCLLIFDVVGLARITSCETSIIVYLRMSGDEVHDSSHVNFNLLGACMHHKISSYK